MKKLSSLHIINGDASLPAFEAAQLPGQVLVWREILSEGPVIGNLPEQEFWKLRQRYITATYAETEAQHTAKVLNELPKLRQAHTFFEVVLWFDADLMCQVNFLYLLQQLSRQEIKIITYCAPALNKNISLLPTAEMQALYENRQHLAAEQLQQAQNLWELYANPEPLKLQQYLQDAFILLPHLKQALTLHFSRFPDCETGLSTPQQQLLSLVQQGATGLRELLDNYWQRHPAYGYGDWQLQKLLQQIQPTLVSQQEPYELTPLGEKIFDQKGKYLEWLEKKPYLGGYRLTPEHYVCYNRIKKELSLPPQNK